MKTVKAIATWVMLSGLATGTVLLFYFAPSANEQIKQKIRGDIVQTLKIQSPTDFATFVYIVCDKGKASAVEANISFGTFGEVKQVVSLEAVHCN